MSSPRPLSDRLRDGDGLSALFVKMPAPAQVEAAGHAGFDVVLLDTEHGPAGGLELEHHLRAADAVGLPALVRVGSNDPPGILAALDAGAAGVVVPHVLDAAQAEAAVAAAHYPPRGRRGFALSTRAGRYGSVGVEEHLRRAADQTCVVVQIEDAAAVGRGAEILGVDGVSAVLIGVADLSLSLGHPGVPPHPAVEAAVDEILAAARAAGVAVIAVAGTPAEAPRWRARGAAVVTSVASSLVGQAFAAAVRETGARAPASGREPVVLLPGMLEDAHLWEDVAPALLESAAPVDGRIDLDDSVAEMAASVLAAAPDRFALAGHSLGAIVALEVVRQAPARVTRLALLNASARPASPGQLRHWDELEARLAADGLPSVADTLVREGLAPAHRDDDALLRRATAMAHAIGAGGLRRQLTAQRTRPDSRPALGEVHVPVLVLSGDQDEVAPPELQVELAGGLRSAEHITVEASGHLTPLEDPNAVAGHLRRWLAA